MASSRSSTLWPSLQQLGTFTKISELLAFYNVEAATWTAFCETAGDPKEDLRPLVALPAAMVAAAVEAATSGSPNGKLSLMEASQLGLVYRCANKVIFFQAGGDIDKWEDPHPWETPSSPTTPVGTGTSSTTLTTTRRMKNTHVLDQADETEFDVADDGQRSKWLQAYVRQMGSLPPEEEEPSVEQMSAFAKRLLENGGPPYADFSVWVPFGKKAYRASKYKAYLPTPSGEFIMKEIPGPSNFTQWQASFKVYRTAMLMVEAASLSTLMAYEAHIEKLTKWYPTAWHLVVSAEDRARSDHMARVKLNVEMDIAAMRPPPRGWNSSRPWDGCFKLVTEDVNYWNVQVQSPAVSWLAQGSRGLPRTPAELVAMESIKGGVQTITPEVEDKNSYASPKKAINKERKEAKKRRWKAEKEELAKYRSGNGGKDQGGTQKGGKGNSKGEALCFSWNNGNGPCAGLEPGAECKNRVKRAHRCTLCGSPAHPSKSCPTSSKG